MREKEPQPATAARLINEGPPMAEKNQQSCLFIHPALLSHKKYESNPSPGKRTVKNELPGSLDKWEVEGEQKKRIVR